MWSVRQRLASPAPGGRTAPLILTAPLSRVARSDIVRYSPTEPRERQRPARYPEGDGHPPLSPARAEDAHASGATGRASVHAQLNNPQLPPPCLRASVRNHSPLPELLRSMSFAGHFVPRLPTSLSQICVGSTDLGGTLRFTSLAFERATSVSPLDHAPVRRGAGWALRAFFCFVWRFALFFKPAALFLFFYSFPAGARSPPPPPASAATSRQSNTANDTPLPQSPH